MPASAYRYLSTLVSAAQGLRLGERDKRELQTLAICCDQLARGNTAGLRDTLMQRFSAVESSVNHRTWDYSKHLESVPQDHFQATSMKKQGSKDDDSRISTSRSASTPWRRQCQGAALGTRRGEATQLTLSPEATQQRQELCGKGHSSSWNTEAGQASSKPSCPVSKRGSRGRRGGAKAPDTQS